MSNKVKDLSEATSGEKPDQSHVEQEAKKVTADEEKRLNAAIPARLRQVLHFASAAQERPIKEIVTEALYEWIDRHYQGPTP